ncbi:hypothetical protein CBR_g34026 [Chara braunii]|uniref:Uncharacterized protein n=1 Tax=Chara braunii TaxID=69332 RepID=A0A388LHP4_CHABU|nr:hypothetical protein CBR_g34026 [Chara braunii]|eukprot:GBG81844.1 hypothetical protein CBR_g34026 [Chara braunii]
MSFLTERALSDHMLAPRRDISAIRQVYHLRPSPDLLRLVQFFSTTGVYVAAEFRFTGHRQAIVLAEATTVRRLSAPGVSHVSTIAIFSDDISAMNPLRHTAIRTSLTEWGQQLATEWNQWLTRRDDNLVPTDDIHVGGLRTSWHEPTVIVQELTIPLAQLVDDLPLNIVSQCDESPVSHVLLRTLTPYLQSSACLEEKGGNSNPPSQREYLDPRRIINLAFFQPRTASEDEGLTLEEEEEENVEEGAEEEEEKTPEEGSYNEHTEGEQSEEEEEEGEEDEEQKESEWEDLGEEVDHTEVQEEDPEAVARRREEIVAGKQPLEYASGTNLPTLDDPTKDPEPPKPEDGTLLPRLRAHRSDVDEADPPPPPPPPVHQFEFVPMRGIGLRPRSLSRRPLDHLTLRQITTRITFPRNPFQSTPSAFSMPPVLLSWFIPIPLPAVPPRSSVSTPFSSVPRGEATTSSRFTA